MKYFVRNRKLLITLLLAGSTYMCAYWLLVDDESSVNLTSNPAVAMAKLSVDKILKPEVVEVKAAASNKDLDTVTDEKPSRMAGPSHPLGLTVVEQQALLKWEKERGYALLKSFQVAGLIQDNEEAAHPHLRLPLYELEVLALNGDVDARMFYALNIRENEPEKALEHFTEAAIDGGYTSAFNYIASTFANQLKDAQNLQHLKEQGQLPVDFQIPNFNDEEKEEMNRKAYVWALVGKSFGDIYALDLLSSLNYQGLSAQEQKILEQEAKHLRETVYLTRHSRGLGDFPDSTVSNAVAVAISSGTPIAR